MTVEQLPSRPAWFDVLVQRATRADGQPPFSDGSLVELVTGKRRLLAIGDVAAALYAPGEAEFVIDPDARRHGHGTELLEHLLGLDAGLKVWAHGDHRGARALAASHGLEPVRELLQLRAALPRAVPEPVEGHDPAADASTGSATEGFVVGRDEDAWLELNARAFASHPEQGAVTRADLDVLMSEPWFDADDFLLLRDGDALVGYCWLKVEHGLGEFYVVGVSPDRQGEGLGRRLVEAGLRRLAERGIRDARLYVEADNAPAVALYRSYGFDDHSIDIQYTRP
jgi:mycothiol synthase